MKTITLVPFFLLMLHVQLLLCYVQENKQTSTRKGLEILTLIRDQKTMKIIYICRYIGGH